MKLELIGSWDTIWKLWSVKISAWSGALSAFGAAIAATGAIVPWFGILPRWEVLAMASAVFWSIFISRILKQKKLHGDDA